MLQQIGSFPEGLSTLSTLVSVHGALKHMFLKLLSRLDPVLADMQMVCMLDLEVFLVFAMLSLKRNT